LGPYVGIVIHKVACELDLGDDVLNFVGLGHLLLQLLDF
jgi:hypothetical protein